MNLNAAGIDVGATEHWVAVPEDRDEEPVRRFGAFTAALYVLAEWLRQCQIETVVMESTGVYWIAISKCSKSVALMSSWSMPMTRAKCQGARRTLRTVNGCKNSTPLAYSTVPCVPKIRSVGCAAP